MARWQDWKDATPESDNERWWFIMAAIDDLNAVVAAIQQEQAAVDAAVNDLVAEVAALKSSGADTTAIEAAVSNLQNVVTAQKTDAAQDPGAQPAPTPPAPPAS